MQGAGPNDHIDTLEVEVTINATMIVAVDPTRSIDDQMDDIHSQLRADIKREPEMFIENKTLGVWDP